MAETMAAFVVLFGLIQVKRTRYRTVKNTSLANIISNAFDGDLTAGQAVADLEKLMNEATLLELTHGQHSPCHIELQKLIPVQERLVRAKMDVDPIFDRRCSLKVSVPED